MDISHKTAAATAAVKALTLGLLLLAVNAVGAPKPVAVFFEDGFPMYLGMPALLPDKFVETLYAHHVPAEPLTAAELANPAIFNTNRFTVLVMPYGNAFPEPAFANLRAFHASGGCLVMNSVPFCHPCKKIDGKWTDLGNVNYFDHNSNGIGTGNFNDARWPSWQAHYLIPANFLGLNQAMRPDNDGYVQCFDFKTLDKIDQVFPLVDLVISNQVHVVSALVRHRCREFNGARDVWLGAASIDGREWDYYYAPQLVVRGVLWCQEEKGEISPAIFQARLAELDKERPPKAAPHR